MLSTTIKCSEFSVWLYTNCYAFKPPLGFKIVVRVEKVQYDDWRCYNQAAFSSTNLERSRSSEYSTPLGERMRLREIKKRA